MGNEILELRTVHQQLSYHLSKQEKDSLNIDGLLSKTFKEISQNHLLQCSRYTNEKWKSCASNYERLMIPAENCVAEKLKNLLNPSNKKINQQIDSFARYKNLIKRPLVAKHLTNERMSLLAQLKNHVKNIKSEFHQKFNYEGR